MTEVPSRLTQSSERAIFRLACRPPSSQGIHSHTIPCSRNFSTHSPLVALQGRVRDLLLFCADRSNPYRIHRI